jgi:hypothetical protein
MSLMNRLGIYYINTVELTDEPISAPNLLTTELLPWIADTPPKLVNKGGSGDFALQDPLRLSVRKVEPL